jgi:acetate kinase
MCGETGSRQRAKRARREFDNKEQARNVYVSERDEVISLDISPPAPNQTAQHVWAFLFHAYGYLDAPCACEYTFSVVGTPILLTINNGSSSCKAALFTFSPQLELVAETTFHRTGTNDLLEAIQNWLQDYTSEYPLAAVGHRFVHGGMAYDSPRLITPEVLDNFEDLQAFDPLHAKPATELMREFVRLYPDTPQVACFDTSFFADMPAVAKLIALPKTLRDAGVRRYGFHGLSYAYVQREFERGAGTVARNGRVVYAHLGSGSSLMATRSGIVMDTTMGFSPVSGVPSSTRSGDTDPTIASFAERTQGINPSEFAEITQTRSGLLAVSDTSGDMKHLLEIEQDDPRAAEAVSFYVYNVQKAIGSLAAAVGGLDSLVFTGGIGEDSSVIRRRICAGLSFLGIELDDSKNDRHEFTISATDSGAGVHVIRTNEAVIMAEQTLRLTEGVSI